MNEFMDYGSHTGLQHIIMDLLFNMFHEKSKVPTLIISNHHIAIVAISTPEDKTVLITRLKILDNFHRSNLVSENRVAAITAS
jgi:hypothetical protein